MAAEYDATVTGAPAQREVTWTGRAQQPATDSVDHITPGPTSLYLPHNPQSKQLHSKHAKSVFTSSQEISFSELKITEQGNRFDSGLSNRLSSLVCKQHGTGSMEPDAEAGGETRARWVVTLLGAMSWDSLARFE